MMDCMIFLSPFLDIARMSMSTVTFLAQLDSKTDLLHTLIILLFFFCNSMPLECLALHGGISIKKLTVYPNCLSISGDPGD